MKGIKRRNTFSTMNPQFRKIPKSEPLSETEVATIIIATAHKVGLRVSINRFKARRRHLHHPWFDESS